MIRLRDTQEADWSDIAWLASDAVQDGDHAGSDTQWVDNRRAFEGVRRDKVAESNGKVAGYCSIERRHEEPAGRYRVFLVADWDEGNRPVHEALFRQVVEMLADEAVTEAWMRELTGDSRLLDFVRSHGFQASEPYEFAGKELVNLTWVIK